MRIEATLTFLRLFFNGSLGKSNKQNKKRHHCRRHQKTDYPRKSANLNVMTQSGLTPLHQQKGKTQWWERDAARNSARIVWKEIFW